MLAQRIRSRWPVLLLAGLLVAVTPAMVVADDLAPAPFRGAPNSLMAKFDLFGATVPGGPTDFVIAPGATYPLDPINPMVDNPSSNGNSLIYPFVLPNFIDQEPVKRIRVQYSWFDSLTGTSAVNTVGIVPSPGGNVVQVGSSPAMQVPGTANVFHRWDDFEIFPNPDWERFEIEFIDADPRWVIFDTISLPEPTSLALLGLLSMALTTRCRR